MDMLKVLLLVILFAITGCAMRLPGDLSSGDDFDCKQKCGYYNPYGNMITAAMCLNDCIRSKNQ